MVDGEDVYQHQITMARLADELEEVMTTEVTNEDFVIMVCFSIMEIP